jgi:hypothetical protein
VIQLVSFTCKPASVTLILLIALALAGCGQTASKGSTSNSTALALERTDLVLVSHALTDAEASVQREVVLARQTWAQIAHGLPTQISSSLKLSVSTANSAASQIQAPIFMTQAEGPTTKLRRDLTGPAAGIAGLFQSFTALSEHGWKQIAATTKSIGQGTPTSDVFLRANAPLYIASIYDGHFDLASIGKHLQKAYLKLGGSSGFGAPLSASEIDRLAGFYGTGLKLEPHTIGHAL